jgi:phosphatidylserine/phosphatidylglycerophosphate/cardiolipin synthase-like enzyme
LTRLQLRAETIVNPTHRLGAHLVSDWSRAIDYKARLAGRAEDVRAFLRAHPLELYGVIEEGDRVSIDVYASARTLEQAKRHGLAIEVLLDATRITRELPVGRGNRFADGSLPRGVGLITRKD